MRIAPLPVHTRLYHGESLDSYIRRHAARNYCTPSDIDRALRERGVVKSKNRRDPARLQAWLDLADMAVGRFTAPEYVLDQEVTERALCLSCTRGEPARGKPTGIGLVCSATGDGLALRRPSCMATSPLSPRKGTSGGTLLLGMSCTIRFPC